MVNDDSTLEENGLSLALLGHDLRAAFAEMRSSLHLLNALSLPPEAHDLLSRCRAVGGTLDRLIDQSVLVCLGQCSPVLSGGQLVTTRLFLDGLQHRWSGRASESGHRFELIAAGDLPDSFRVDRNGLERILANLIGNALRHTPPGTITVTFKISGGDLLLIAVEDQGPGFPAAFLGDLQANFAIPAEAHREGGGFGLQSVKCLVDAMGGRCNARNKIENGGGAEVSICLPITSVHANTDAQRQPQLPPTPDLNGIKVLLAEDSASSREMVSVLAKALGVHLTMVNEGKAAMAALENGPLPDVLILDDEMPGATGLEVLSWMQGKSADLARLPVLALTSHIGADKVNALLNAGASLVLAKPVLCPLELGRALCQARGQSHDQSQGIVQNAPPAPQIQDLSALHRLAQIAGPEAAAELFDRLEEDLTRAKVGLALGAADGDLAAIRNHSHVLIALAGTVGATGLHEDAVALNGLAHGNQPKERAISLAASLRAKLEPLLDAIRDAAVQAKNAKAPGS